MTSRAKTCKDKILMHLKKINGSHKKLYAHIHTYIQTYTHVRMHAQHYLQTNQEEK